MQLTINKLCLAEVERVRVENEWIKAENARIRAERGKTETRLVVAKTTPLFAVNRSDRKTFAKPLECGPATYALS